MSFTLVRKNVNLPVDNDQLVYPLEISCTAGTPIEIFVYRAALGLQPGLGDVFSCIASPQQLRTLPVDRPTVDDLGRAVPFFRKSVLRLDCQTATQVDFIWNEVLAQVVDLQDALNLEPYLEQTATVTIDGGYVSPYINLQAADDQSVAVELPAFRRGDQWQGILAIGPIVIDGLQPVDTLARILMRFVHTSGAVYQLDSATGGILIEDAVTWLATIPPVDAFLPLVGRWEWDMGFYKTGAASPITLYHGVIQVTRDL